MGIPLEIKRYVRRAHAIITDGISMGRKAGTTIGTNSVATGSNVEASGNNSHAEGYLTEASGNHSHAEGGSTLSSGSYSHAEGYNSVASGSTSHAEGSSTVSIGTDSHAEGTGTMAKHIASHAEGEYTETKHEAQHVSGTYNEVVDGYEVVGMGDDDDNRANARVLDLSGNEKVAGDVVANAFTDPVSLKTVGRAAIPIVVNGATLPVNVTAGQYILVQGSTITGVTDGLYKASANISSGTLTNGNDLTAVPNGISGEVKALNDQIATLNSKITTINNMARSSPPFSNNKWTATSNGILVLGSNLASSGAWYIYLYEGSTFLNGISGTSKAATYECFSCPVKKGVEYTVLYGGIASFPYERFFDMG